YVPLDNKCYYYYKNFVALNCGYFRFCARCMSFYDKDQISCIYIINIYSKWNDEFQRIIFFKKPTLLENRSIFSNSTLQFNWVKS
ncbi:unnamed protein product, partial [Heterotrigona itama]